MSHYDLAWKYSGMAHLTKGILGGSKKAAVEKEPLPFQAENVATNQQGIPLPYVRGTQVVAVRWVSPALDEITHQVPKNGKKG